MKWKIGRDISQRFLIVWDCKTYEEAIDGVYMNETIMEHIIHEGWRLNPLYIPVQNDDGTWHTFFYLN